jgi:hypothetical protein
MPVDPSLTNFSLASEEDIRKLVKDSPCKSCALDPIPTWVLKECVDVLTPSIATIVNQSLTNGVMPKNLKQALITPLIKKPSLNVELFKNYSPVS